MSPLAVGNIMAEIMFDMQSNQDAPEDPNMSYVERLKTLTAEEWLKSGE